MKFVLLSILTLLNALSTSCIANEESAISIENEIVTISPDSVHVDYDFKNNTHSVFTKTLGFNLAFYSYDPSSKCPDESRRSSNFKMIAKGAEIIPIKSIQARLPLKNGSYKDVTSELHGMGFTDDEISNYRNYEVVCENDMPIPQGKYKSKLKTLIKDGLAQKEDFHPVWETSEVYSLKLEFKPDEIIHLEYEYAPTVGDSNNNLGSGPLTLKGNSIISGIKDLDKDDVRCVNIGEPINGKKALQDQSQFTFRSISHNVTSDAALYGVVKDFTLKVKKIKPQNFIAICFDNKVSKNDEMTLSFHIKNYFPNKDIIADYLYQSN